MCTIGPFFILFGNVKQGDWPSLRLCTVFICKLELLSTVKKCPHVPALILALLAVDKAVDL